MLPNRRFLFILTYMIRVSVFLLAFFLLPPAAANACSPAGQADPWFLYEAQIIPETLPDGVEIISEGGDDPDAETWQGLQKNYFFINKGKIPLYFYRSGLPEREPGDDETSGDQAHWPNSGLPEPLQPIFKLVNKTIYFYLPYGPPEEMGWRVICPEGQDCHSRLPLSHLLQNIHKLMKYDDNRPSYAKIPPPETFQFGVYYGDKPHRLEGSLFFRLNPIYDPEAYAKSWTKGVEACNKWHRSIDSLRQ